MSPVPSRQAAERLDSLVSNLIVPQKQRPQGSVRLQRHGQGLPDSMFWCIFFHETSQKRGDLILKAMKNHISQMLHV